jgi:hypothetical protein
LELDEIECDIDEDFDDEKFAGNNINNSFINKLKDFSTFNPSGNKGREKVGGKSGGSSEEVKESQGSMVAEVTSPRG